MKVGATKQYELTFILGEKTTPESGIKKTEAVKKLVTDQKGVVTKEELWGRRELAYQIGSNRSGFYVTLWLDIDGEGLKNLQKEMSFDADIIRFLATIAYTTAQPGTLYPVVEGDEKSEKPAGETPRKEKESTSVSAEEMLRSHSAPAKTEKPSKKAKDTSEDLPEEERLEKLDTVLEEMLKDELE
ncbi:MAG: 30S ribosomal protein S6 [bacterium]